MRLFLVRHPRPAVDGGVCYGRSDVALAEDVSQVAARLRSLLPTDAPLFSSPLSRCRLLAEALHPAPQFDERLREIDFGGWEMRAWDDIGREALDAWAADPLNYADHGGESVAMLRERAVACLREIGTRHHEAVFVLHAGVMKALAAELLDLPEADWLAMSFGYGTVSLIEDDKLVWHNVSAVA